MEHHLSRQIKIGDEYAKAVLFIYSIQSKSFPQQSYAFVERNRMNVVEIPFFTVHHETIGEEAAVSPDEPHLLIRQNRKCLIKKRSVVAQICCIARTQPGVHYHSHLGCKGDKG